MTISTHYSNVFISIILLLGSLFKTYHCLYEDQTGKFDWRQQYVGRVAFVHPRIKSGTLVVATESNVIANIRMRDGSIIWRQVLPNGCTLSSMSVIESPKTDDSYVKTTCANGDEFIWNPYNGLIAQNQNVKGKKSSPADSGNLLDIVWKTQIRPNTLPKSDLVYKAFAVAYEDTDTKDKPSQVLLNLRDDELSLWDSFGQQLWSRQESLASVVSAEFVELPLSKEDSEIELGFKTKMSFVDQFIKRISTQVGQVKSLFTRGPQALIDIVARASTKAQKFALKDATSVMLDKTNLSKDVFGLRKLIVTVSTNGKLFGIDSLTGNIVWHLYDEDFSTVGNDTKSTLIVMREARHSNHGQAVIIHPEGHLMTFNTILGLSIEKLKFPRIKQISIFEPDSVEEARGIILLDEHDKVHIFPKSYEKKFQVRHQNYFMTVVEKDRSQLVGYKFELSGPSSQKILSKVTWVFPMVNGEKIEEIAFKRRQEVIHSPARVLGDRSILYKYVNPNLVAIVSKGVGDDSCNPESSTSIYLLDGVTGSLVYSVNHPKTKGPTRIVHSENWLVYSYFNSKVRRMEVSSVELFEGSSQANGTHFSSLTRSSIRPKLIEHKSFIFPGGINAMKDTTTQRGMTNKNIIMALHTGALLELPKMFLDPRRPINILPEHREEGLIPYMPEIPILSESTINYNQSVFGIRGIQTAGANLESTCLVFVYGLDLFFTRVTPSKTFDILKDDFDHLLISAVLSFLVIASVVSKRLAQQKALNNAWK